MEGLKSRINWLLLFLKLVLVSTYTEIDGTLAGDNAGYFLSDCGDFNGDANTDLCVGTPSVNSGAGAAYIVFGNSSYGSQSVSYFNLSDLTGNNGFLIQGNGSQSAGTSISVLDVNGDRYLDVLVGAPGLNSGPGNVFVLLGNSIFNASYGTKTLLSDGQGFRIGGVVAERLGRKTIRVGDVNLDTFDDFAISAHGDNPGRVYLLYGRKPSDPWPLVFFPSTNMTDADGVIFVGVTGSPSSFGFDISSGFINKGNIPDLIIGSPFEAGNGSAYVIFGASTLQSPFSMNNLDGTNGFRITGFSNSLFGYSVKCVKDFNADGYDDFVISAPIMQEGAIVVIFGTSDWNATFDIRTLNGTNGFTIYGENFGDEFGLSISDGFDQNQDGYVDFLVGAPMAASFGIPSSGRVYLIYGNQSSTWPTSVSIKTLISESRATLINGTYNGGAAGSSVTFAGDFNGDSHPDFAFSSPGASPYNFSEAGATFIIYGESNPTTNYSVIDNRCPLPPPLTGIGGGNCIIPAFANYQCMLNCTSGFIGQGDVGATCLGEGNWNFSGSCQDIDECQLNACPVDAVCNNTVGSFFCTCNTSGYATNGSFGSPCLDINECLNSSTCNPNSTCTNLNGSYLCCNSGYVANGTTCEAVICATNSIPPANGTPGDCGTTQVSFGQTCNSTCNVGYTASAVPTRTCQANGILSTWNGICAPIKCATDSGTAPTNGAAGECGNKTISVGQTCTTSCNLGFDGAPTRTCQTDGTLGPINGSCACVNGSCPAVACDDYFPNASNLDPMIGCTSNSVGASCTLVCLPNYFINSTNSTTVTCLSNGQWSTPPDCQAGCGQLAFPANSHAVGPCNTNYEGSSCNFSCNLNYTQMGGNRVVCQNNGSWISEGVCLANCGQPSLPANAFWTDLCNQTYSGKTCNFACLTSYELVGSNATICQENGTWSSSGKCLAKCGTFTPTSTSQLMTPSCNGFENDFCNISCKNGFGVNATTNQTTIQCQPNGSWTTPQQCLAYCGKFIIPTYSFYDNKSICNGILAPSSCNLTCQSKYIINQTTMSSSIVCTTAGWTVPPNCTVGCLSGKYLTSSGCANCDINAHSSYNSLGCDCNSGYSGTGIVCFPIREYEAITSDTGLEIRLYILTTPELIGLNTTEFGNAIIGDLSNALNLSRQNFEIKDMKIFSNDTTLVTLDIYLHDPASQNRSLVDIAGTIQIQLTNPNSTLRNGLVLSYASPNYYEFSLLGLVFTNFLKLTVTAIVIIILFVLAFIAIFHLITRKYYPGAENWRLVSFFLTILSVISKMFFCLFLHSITGSEFETEYAVALGALALPWGLNLILSTYVFHHEVSGNGKFKGWMDSHWITMWIIRFFSIINARNGRLLSSELFGAAQFSAPLSIQANLQLQALGSITNIFSDIPHIVCQLIVSVRLQTFRTTAVIALVFVGISFFFGFFTQFRAFYDLGQYNAKNIGTQDITMSPTQDVTMSPSSHDDTSPSAASERERRLSSIMQ